MADSAKLLAKRDSDQLIFLCCASLTVALLLLQLARLSGRAVPHLHGVGIAHVEWPPPHWLRPTLLISMLLFGLATLGWLWQAMRSSRRAVGDRGGVPAEKATGVRSWLCEGQRPIRWFLGGILVGAIVLFFRGNPDVHDFAGGSAPIVAALLIAVLVPV